LKQIFPLIQMSTILKIASNAEFINFVKQHNFYAAGKETTLFGRALFCLALAHVCKSAS
jgi:hypothetical protein